MPETENEGVSRSVPL